MKRSLNILAAFVAISLCRQPRLRFSIYEFVNYCSPVRATSYW